MRVSYDPRRNVAYIYFRETSEEVETVEVSEDLNVDLAPDGTVYGIELLNASEQLLGNGRKVAFEIPGTGEHIEVTPPGTAA